MEKENILNDFLDEKEVIDLEKKKNKKRIIERTGLIERIDKVYVTNDGRQLLRERY